MSTTNKSPSSTTTTKYTSTILITGGTAGLGYEAALSLARHFPTSHQIIIASRTDKDAAATKINQTLKQSNTVFLPLDLSNPDSISSFAKTITSQYPKITHLLLNAGLQFPGGLEFFQPENGKKIEKTFQVNHLGHAQLFFLLLPHLSQDLHLVITSSGTHDPAQKSGLPDANYTTAEEVAVPDSQKANKDGRERYATSKLCNVLWTYALERRAKSSSAAAAGAAGKEGGKEGWKVNAFDPGLIPGTGLAREYPALLRFIWLHIFPRIIPVLKMLFKTGNIHTAKESGGNLARLAIGEDERGGDSVKGASGKYWEGRKVIRSSEVSYDEGKQEDLWKWTVEFVSKGDEGLKGRWDGLKV